MENNQNSLKKVEQPVLFAEKQNCCGCSACYLVCPVRAIIMEEDEEGFLYPNIDRKKCIKCYSCLKVCAFKDDQAIKGYYAQKREASAEK